MPIPLVAYHLPCCALAYFIFTYPAVRFSRFSPTTYPAVPLLILFSLTLLYAFPAFRLPLTLLCPCLFYFHLPCCTLSHFSPTTYPAVPLLILFSLTQKHHRRNLLGFKTYTICHH